MKKPNFFIDIFLQPGELYFGDSQTRIRTILGSCVSITLWHPHLKIGGMCHYMLPENKLNVSHDELDGRYADHALELFMTEIKVCNTLPGEYEVKMFGGGDQFPGHGKPHRLRIPDNNIKAGMALLEHYGFNITATHLGGNGHRTVIFDIWSGHVWLRHFKKEI